jgi:hypothetical protein
MRYFAMNRSDNKGNSLEVNKIIIAKKLVSLSSEYPRHIVLAYTANMSQQRPFRTISLTRNFLRCVVYLVKLQVTMDYIQKILKLEKSTFALTKKQLWLLRNAKFYTSVHECRPVPV